jgi:o-succinylbenzoate---CoA ligase
MSALARALDGTGPAILPLDPELPQAALARILETLAPSAIVTRNGKRSLIPRADGAPAGGVAGQGVAEAGVAEAGVAEGGVAEGGVAEDTAVVIATSGSMGTPKGVELTAAALTASASASLRRIGAGDGDRWLCCLPTFHIAGLGVLVRSLLSGTDPVLTAKLDGEVIAAAGCQHVSLVPTQLRRLLTEGASPGGLRTVLLGGAAAPGDLLAEARGAGWHVVTTYGMSETCGGCVYDGVPLDGVQVGTGADGRIEISGNVLFSGYRLRPDLTDAALAGGRFRTSDLGYMGTDGHLVIRGRADDVINTGGEKVVPGEVEAVLGTCHGVSDVVVLGVPDAEWGELVTAFVVPSVPSDPPDLAQLRTFVRQALSAPAAPRKLIVMPVFPLLPSGKPDREALRASALRAQRELGN